MLNYCNVKRLQGNSDAPLQECHFDFSDELKKFFGNTNENKPNTESTPNDENNKTEIADVTDAAAAQKFDLIFPLKKWLFSVFEKNSCADFLLAGAIIGKFNLNEFYQLAENYNINKCTANAFLQNANITPPTRNSRRISISELSNVIITDTNGDRVYDLQGVYLRIPVAPRFNDFDVTKATRHIAKLIGTRKVPIYVSKFIECYSTPPSKISTTDFSAPIDESKNFSSIPLRILIKKLRRNFHCNENTIWNILIDSVEPSKIVYRDFCGDYCLIFKDEKNNINEILRPQLFIELSEYKRILDLVEKEIRAPTQDYKIEFLKEIFSERNENECQQILKMLAIFAPTLDNISVTRD